MGIIVKIKPLYDDLVNLGLSKFITDNEFIRICDELNISQIYADASNEAEKSDWAFWESTYDGKAILSGFLNKLYTATNINFPYTVSYIVTRFIPLSYFISSISDFKRDIQLLGGTKEDLSALDAAWQKESKNWHKKALVLKETTIARAVGGYGDEVQYAHTRKALLQNSSLKECIPDFIVKNETIHDFWQFIKSAYGSYKERRYFLIDSFTPLLNAISANENSTPHEDHVSSITQEINEEYISSEWRKALNRIKEDPEAAITSARTLIEHVCKYILDESGITYNDAADLPKLYKQTASSLNLSPDQHTESIFKQILGGCQAVVDGLGALRNKLSDAHGKSKTKIRPSERHAALAVNLSGAMCSYLLQTYLVKLKNDTAVT